MCLIFKCLFILNSEELCSLNFINYTMLAINRMAVCLRLSMCSLYLESCMLGIFSSEVVVLSSSKRGPTIVYKSWLAFLQYKRIVESLLYVLTKNHSTFVRQGYRWHHTTMIGHCFHSQIPPQVVPHYGFQSWLYIMLHLSAHTSCFHSSFQTLSK